METGEFAVSTRRVLFTEDGKPLPGLEVRLTEDSSAFATDDEGQLELPIGEGRGTLHVHHQGEWREQVVDTARDSSLVMVDLSRNKTGPQLDADTSFLDIGKLNLGERYVYLEVLGRGGMSIVLKARDRLLNREVAVKLLSQELQNQPEAQEIFLAEARSLATLSHPNLVAVHDICKVDDRVFMVIEHVEGKSLEHLIKHVRRLNETVTLQLVIQMCRVVAYLHDHGLIHRDLKPANAMIRHDGTLKLIDFGLARHFDDMEIRGTRVRGTPAYMAPEQIKGDQLTPSCDIYQLGVCLFECITGRLPFNSGDMGYAHVHTAPPRIEKFAVGVSLALSDIVDACLSKDPTKRPANAKELLKELQGVYQSLGSQAGGASLLEHLQSVPDSNESLEDPPRLDVDEERPGYSTSEIGLMEGAGRHLRTSEIRIKKLSEVIADPDHRGQIIIQQMGPSWQSMAVAGIIGAVVAGAISWGVTRPLMMAAPPQTIERPSEPARFERDVAPEIAPVAATRRGEPTVSSDFDNIEITSLAEPAPSEGARGSTKRAPTAGTNVAGAQPRLDVDTQGHEADSDASTPEEPGEAQQPPPADRLPEPMPLVAADDRPGAADDESGRPSPFLKATNPVRKGFIHTSLNDARPLPRD